MKNITRKPLTGLWRLQFGAQAHMTLRQAANRWEDYIRHLLGHNRRTPGSVGIYLPPIQTSPADSNHYYNGLNPNEVAPNLGGRKGLDYLAGSSAGSASSGECSISFPITATWIGIRCRRSRKASLTSSRATCSGTARCATRSSTSIRLRARCVVSST